MAIYFGSYLLRIFETQPWLTLNWREMTQGRTPAAAISIIFKRIWLGKGRPLMKTPPNWFTLPWPKRKKFKHFKIKSLKIKSQATRRQTSRRFLIWAQFEINLRDQVRKLEIVFWNWSWMSQIFRVFPTSRQTPFERWGGPRKTARLAAYRDLWP